MRYIATAAETVTLAELEAAIEQELLQQGGDIMPTLAEQWIQQGLEKGIRQGKIKGRYRAR